MNARHGLGNRYQRGTGINVDMNSQDRINKRHWHSRFRSGHSIPLLARSLGIACLQCQPRIQLNSQLIIFAPTGPTHFSSPEYMSVHFLTVSDQASRRGGRCVRNLNFSPVWLHNLVIGCFQPLCGLSDCLGSGPIQYSNYVWRYGFWDHIWVPAVTPNISPDHFALLISRMSKSFAERLIPQTFDNHHMGIYRTSFQACQYLCSIVLVLYAENRGGHSITWGSSSVLEVGGWD
jgi:hypothetical protein